ncbi:MAG TPA: VTT domain-containing protein [Polyangiaceae bacterium]|nr:VTT domain-containing protein [Polyangiaceae bacterium]
MSADASAEDRPEAARPDSDAEGVPWRLLLRWGAALLVLLLIVATIARAFRPELETVGRGFVDRYGFFGMALGTFIADAFSFPVPPQFYMLLSIAAGDPAWLTLLVTCVASLLAGTTGYCMARRLAGWPRLARWLERSTNRVQRLNGSQAYRAAAIASFTPVAYSMLCYLAGAHRVSWSVYGVIALLRIPKLIVFYYLVKFGWSLL